MARVAEALAVAWNTANDAVLAEGRRVLISDAVRFDGVKVIGVDEHVWRHTRGLAGLLLGSTSSQCAQHAACPVLVVVQGP